MPRPSLSLRALAEVTLAIELLGVYRQRTDRPLSPELIAVLAAMRRAEELLESRVARSEKAAVRRNHVEVPMVGEQELPNG